MKTVNRPTNTHRFSWGLWVWVGAYLYSAWAWGQNPAWQEVPEQDRGLADMPAMAVYQMALDAQGRLLMTSDKGVWRYNGSHSRPLPPDQSLRSSVNLVHTYGQRTWAVTFSGQLYEVRGDSLHQEKVFPTAMGTCIGLMANTQGRYLAFQHQLLHQAWNDSLWQPLAFWKNPASPFSEITGLVSSSQGKGALVTSEGAVWLWIPNQAPQSLGFLPEASTHRGLHRIVFQQETLLATMGHIPFSGYLRYESGSWKSYPLPPPAIRHTVLHPHASAGLAGVASTGGLISTKGQVWLPGTPVSQWLYQASEQRLWISTLNESVKRINRGTLRFQHEGQVPKPFRLGRRKGGGFWMGDIAGRLWEFDSQGRLLDQLNLGTQKEVEFISHSRDSTQLLCSEGYFDLSTRQPQVHYLSKAAITDPEGHIVYFTRQGLYVISPSNQPSALWGPAIQTLAWENRFVHAHQYNRYRQAEWWGSTLVLATSDTVELRQSPQLSRAYHRQAFTRARLAVWRDSLYLAAEEGLFVWKGKDWQLRWDQPLRQVLAQGSSLYLETDLGQIYRWQGAQPTWLLQLPNDSKDWLPTPEFLVVARPSGLYRHTWGSLRKPQAPRLVSQIRVAPFEKRLFALLGLEASLEWVDLSGQTPQLEYRLKELNSPWQTLSENPGRALFPTLWPGTYTLEVRDGWGWHQEFPVQIPRPWWLTAWALLVAGLTLSIGILAIIQWQKRRQAARQRLEENLAHSRLVALRAQMNPHFLFNVLNSIQGLVYENKADEATEQIQRYATFTRLILDQSAQNLITLREELETLETYLSLEAERMGPSFRWTCEVSDELDPTACTLPPLMIQPLVENALLHGLLHAYGTKELHIRFSVEAGPSLVVEVEDNGVGREAAWAYRSRRGKAHQSFASQALAERLALLSQRQGQTYTLSYTDLVAADGSPGGTLARLHLPLNLPTYDA